MTSPRIPGATYRLQFTPDFGFRRALELVPHLHALGITDVYASPILLPQRGSTHGYDVTDHSQVNPALGTEDDLRALADELRRRGMGLILDVVPNHMGIADDTNAWWMDVLENGPSSPFAKFFDIDWNPPKAELVNRVMLPVLGDQFGAVLEDQQLRLVQEEGKLWIVYWDKRFPVGPRSLSLVLAEALERLHAAVNGDDPQAMEIESLIMALRHLPPRTARDPQRVQERMREREVIHRRLGALLDSGAEARAAFGAAIERFNGTPGDPRSFDPMESLLADQAYRLCFWRVASDEINYRRFFDVNHLAAIRIEDPEVFAAVHEIPLRLIREGRVTGLRIDHPDGLHDPVQYFADLADACAAAVAGSGREDGGCWIVVEKILEGEERLSPDWAVHGTTGYEFLNLVNGLMVDPDGARQLRTLWTRLTGESTRFPDLVYRCKKVNLEVSMASELHVLARRLDRISEQHRGTRDFTLWSLHDALTEVIACFPVYRTYTRLGDETVREDDRAHIGRAIRSAKRQNPAVSAQVFDFIADVLLLRDPEGITDEQREARREFVIRFQQLTGPVMAKGLEDTAFYRWYPLASLNEVGGDPTRAGRGVEEFHRHSAERLRDWPHSMLTTSTHDTKRSEDVRARLSVLSEVPDGWAHAVRRWRRLNRRRKRRVEGREVPSAAEELLIHQTLVGIWPLDREQIGALPERMRDYVIKSAREAKIHTSWVSPNEEHEQALAAFVDALFEEGEESALWTEFEAFHQEIARRGAMSSLTQLLLKATSPGVPDCYQGMELWDFSLVDPDNRRPVDHDRRRAMLEDLQRRAGEDLTALINELAMGWRDGRLKLWVMHRALMERRANRALFDTGEHLPLRVDGPAGRHNCAFARREGDRCCVTVVPTRTACVASAHGLRPAESAWGEAQIALPADFPRRWENALTGERIDAGEGDKPLLPLRAALHMLPVALLTPAEEESAP